MVLRFKVHDYSWEEVCSVVLVTSSNILRHRDLLLPPAPASPNPVSQVAYLLRRKRWIRRLYMMVQCRIAVANTAQASVKLNRQSTSPPFHPLVLPMPPFASPASPI